MHTQRQNLLKIDHLKSRRDFLRFSAKPLSVLPSPLPVKKWVSKSMIVLLLERKEDKPGQPILRYGITVTKKLEKTAVGRNRMKRRLRAAAADVLGKWLAESSLPCALDLVLISRPETASRPYTDLCKDLSWCLERLGYKGKTIINHLVEIK